ncbi:PCYCGC domain-containing protein [Heyndrickxia oleronia]|uniref:PCYCGC domain-containing protein n=1 Tax=Heyndrickxia oleronia TaxID=38875 RepID=UPI001C0EE7CF|nr:PCYCGC domain-containing protein [Heyndrickxia oleronia]MBU5211912.1 PCYCGC domain-containing protein [Heyndrickxia oleronia]
MFKKRVLIIPLIVVMFIISACSNSADESKEPKEKEVSHTMPVEETASAAILPSFIDNSSETIQTIYQAAASHQELLEHMPCYCGCGEMGHENNYDCFIQENKRNGAIVWDEHGVNCDVCLEIAAESMVEYQKGKSMLDIRKEIDEKYKEGYAKPTPTPMPEA